MILKLTAFGLILIPLYEIIFRFFPNVNVVSGDTRSHKELMAVALALFIGLLALYQGKMKPFRNKWLLFFIGLQMITINLMPRIPLVINGNDNSGFWVWKPMFEVLCFLLMGITLASIDIKKRDIDKLMRIICLVMVIQAGYVILQSMGLDQFFRAKSVGVIGAVEFAGRVGVLGQPTLVSPFIAMGIPIALYMKRFLFAAIMALAVFLTHSQVAVGAMIISLLAYICLIRPKNLMFVLPISLIGVITSLKMGLLNIEGNGRFEAWKITLNGILDTKISGYEGLDFSLFGHGLGSFAYLSPTLEGAKHMAKFSSAHNEYLEIWWCCGIFGLVLAVMAIGWIFINGFKKTTEKLDYTRLLNISLLCSLLVSSLSALGTFTWQLGAHAFYTVFFVGLILNNKNGGEKCLNV